MKPETLVKICCISSHEEAEIAIRYGAHALGLVGEMPSGPGVIDDESIRRIAQNAPSNIRTFLLTCETEAEAIIDHHRRTLTNTIQLVDRIDTCVYRTLRQNLPNIDLVQVVHVIDESSLAEAINISQHVDFILLDSGNPNKAVKELGGTGRVHNWDISRQIVEKSAIPVFLAGGLSSKNVRQSIQTVAPYGLDLCSGVRTNGQLDEQKLKAFMDLVL